jgi:nucleoid-associated protein YgaU
VAGTSSRHQRLATYTRSVGDDAPIELYRPRPAPKPEAALLHQVTADDRLDLLAYRYYGDPLQYWRIVDANPARSPEDLLEVGRTLVIPKGS